MKITLQELAQSLKDLINGKASSSDLSALDTKVTEHLAEEISQLVIALRDVSIAGKQSFSLPFKAKNIVALSTITNTDAISHGIWSGGTNERCISKKITVGYVGTTGIIRLYSSATDYVTGFMTNVTDVGFDIDWYKTGNPTGEASIYLLVSTHGEG